MPEDSANPNLAEPLIPHSKKLLTLAALLLVLSVVATYVWFNSYPTWFGGASFFLTAWGVIISLAGFAFTIVQLARTKKAAQEVGRALVKVKKDYASFDVVAEARTARAAAEEAQAHVVEGRWQLALGSYGKIRSSMSKMIAVQNGISGDERELAKDFLATVMSASLSLEAVIISNQELDIGILTGRLRELDDYLIKVEFGTKDSASGQH